MSKAHDIETTIANSNDVKSEIAKKAIIHLFRVAKEELCDVKMVFPAQLHDTTAEETAYGIHGLTSSGGQTHLDKHLQDSGVNHIHFDSGHHSNVVGPISWIFTGKAMPLGYKDRLEQAKEIVFDPKIVENIELEIQPS